MWQQTVIEKYNISGPRYTSYPTAIQFEDIDNGDKAFSAVIAGLPEQQPISLYVHIPFCSNICFYCGCNKVITRDYGKAVPYLENLYREIDGVAKSVAKRPVSQLHFGGGTPTFLSNEQLADLMTKLKQSFNFQEQTGEFSIEIDPRSVNTETIQHLYTIGFNRISLGIQDFNPVVQKAVNRIQDEEDTKNIIQAARNTGFNSISVDLIYGLPFQTLETFRDTINKIIEIKPDRISVFNYAHLPHRFKPQRRIAAEDLPSADEKLLILELCIKSLTDAGYCYIGMDHFALPEDELAQAQKQRELHRNFQGYTTRGECALIGMGVSSISSVDGHYYQNQRDLPSYYQAIEQGILPIWRGFQMDEDDYIRREVIMQLICHFSLNFSDIENQFSISFKEYFQQELSLLKVMQEDGLITLSNNSIKITDVGRILVRNICMVFDKYLRDMQENRNFSKAI